MAERYAAHDWASTPLGPLESWSQSLRTAVAIVLRSRYPMMLSWGKDMVMLYNDALTPTLGTKHPEALGGPVPEVFSEVWGDIGGMHRSVLAGGTATWDEDLRLTMEFGQGPEETFFTFSYSHVPDGNGPGGVLVVMPITTAKVVGARRLALLNELAQVAHQAVEPDQAMAAAFKVLAGADSDLQGGALYGPEEGAAAPSALVSTASFGASAAGPPPALVDSPEHPVMIAWNERRPIHGADPEPWVALPSGVRTRSKPFCCCCPTRTGPSTTITRASRARSPIRWDRSLRSRRRGPGNRPDWLPWPRSTLPRRHSSPTSVMSSGPR